MDDYPFPHIDEKYRVMLAKITVSTSADGSSPAEVFTDPKDEKLLAYKPNKRGSLTVYNRDGTMNYTRNDILQVLIPALREAWNGNLLKRQEYDRTKTASKRKQRGLPEPLVLELDV